jgi:hypothetical protein
MVGPLGRGEFLVIRLPLGVAQGWENGWAFGPNNTATRARLYGLPCSVSTSRTPHQTGGFPASSFRPSGCGARTRGIYLWISPPAIAEAVGRATSALWHGNGVDSNHLLGVRKPPEADG